MAGAALVWLMNTATGARDERTQGETENGGSITNTTVNTTEEIDIRLVSPLISVSGSTARSAGPGPLLTITLYFSIFCTRGRLHRNEVRIRSPGNRYDSIGIMHIRT